MVERALAWKRIASGDYQSADGRYLLWRLPGVYPPAWNVEDVSTYKLIVDGAASKRDAAALATDRALSQLGPCKQGDTTS